MICANSCHFSDQSIKYHANIAKQKWSGNHLRSALELLDTINFICWPVNTDAIWQYRSWLTLVQVMAWCLMAPSPYLNQSWLVTSNVLCHSPEGNFTRNAQYTINKMHWNITYHYNSLSHNPVIWQSPCVFPLLDSRWLPGVGGDSAPNSVVVHRAPRPHTYAPRLHSSTAKVKEHDGDDWGLDAGISLCMHPASERRRYIVTSSLIV